MCDFTLLIQLRESLKQPSNLSLEQLRAKVKSLQEANNKAIDDLWKLNQEVTKNHGAEQVKMRKKHTELTERFNECNSKKIIEEALEVIKEKEKNEGSKLSVRAGSPYIF